MRHYNILLVAILSSDVILVVRVEMEAKARFVSRVQIEIEAKPSCYGNIFLWHLSLSPFMRPTSPPTITLAILCSS